MVSAGKERLPHEEFASVDVMTDEFYGEFDYVICGATLEHRPKFEDPSKYVKVILTKMFKLSWKALTFDIFSSRIDYKDDEKLYFEPDHLLNFCYTLTNRVVLRNDYRPFELVFCLFKGLSKPSEHILRMEKSRTHDHSLIENGNGEIYPLGRPQIF